MRIILLIMAFALMTEAWSMVFSRGEFGTMFEISVLFGLSTALSGLAVVIKKETN